MTLQVRTTLKEVARTTGNFRTLERVRGNDGNTNRAMTSKAGTVFKHTNSIVARRKYAGVRQFQFQYRMNCDNVANFFFLKLVLGGTASINRMAVKNVLIA
jgi:hypothetical protein